LQSSFTLEDGGMNLANLAASLGNDFDDEDEKAGGEKVSINMKGNDILRLAIDDYISERAK